MGKKYNFTDPEWLEFCKTEFPLRTVTAIGHKYRKIVRKKKELEDKNNLGDKIVSEVTSTSINSISELSKASLKSLSDIVKDATNSALDTNFDHISKQDAIYTDYEIDLVMQGGNKYKFGTPEFESFCSAHFPSRTPSAIN